MKGIFLVCENMPYRSPLCVLFYKLFAVNIDSVHLDSISQSAKTGCRKDQISLSAAKVEFPGYI